MFGEAIFQKVFVGRAPQRRVSCRKLEPSLEETMPRRRSGRGLWRDARSRKKAGLAAPERGRPKPSGGNTAERKSWPSIRLDRRNLHEAG